MNIQNSPRVKLPVMKTVGLSLASITTLVIFSSCASPTTAQNNPAAKTSPSAVKQTVDGANKTVNGVNRVGNTIRSVNLIRGLFN